MRVPDWYTLILLGAAIWRTFQLVAFDDLLDRPRRYALRLGKEWQKDAKPGTPESQVPDEYRLKLGIFITCPYCAGAWIGLGWYLAWLVLPGVFLPLAVIGALFCFPIIGHKLLAKEEDK